MGSVGIMLYFGIRARRIAEAGSDGFLVAGRTLGVLVGTCAVIGAGYSGWSFMGAPGLSYAYGPIELLFNFGFAVSITFAIMFFAGYLRRNAHRMNSRTIPEYISQSHANTPVMSWLIQGSTGFLTLILLMVFMIAQIKAVGLLTSQWLGISPWLASTIIITVIIFYTAFGGLAAVAWTDTIMVFGMLIASVYCTWVCLTDTPLFDLIESLRLSVDNYISAGTAEPYGDSPISAYFSIPYAFFFASVLPYMAVRFLAFKDNAELHKMGLLSAIFCIILSLIPIVGLFMRYKMPGLDNPDMAMPMFLTNFVPPMFSGVLTLFILFAIQSTANSILHTLSTSMMHDMRVALTKNKPISDQKALLLNRLGVIILGVFGIILTYLVPDNIFLNKLHMLGTGTLQAVLIGPVFIGTFWRGNAYGALASMFAGGITAGYMLLCTDTGWVLGPLTGDLVASVLYIFVSMATMKICPCINFYDYKDGKKRAAVA